MDPDPGGPKTRGSGSGSATLVFTFYATYLPCFLVWSTFPEVSEEEKERLKFPNSIEETKALGNILSRFVPYVLFLLLGFLELNSVGRYLNAMPVYNFFRSL
jgi:hypothetical protein